jgi:hypothetical protein
MLAAVFLHLPRLLNPGARIYAENATPFSQPGFETLRGARAGQVHYYLLKQSE